MPAVLRTLRPHRYRLNRQCKRPLLVRIQCAHADELSRDLLAPIVTNRHDDRVFPRVAVGWVPNTSLDPQRPERGLRGRISVVVGSVAEIVLARRAYDSAFENGLP